MIANKYNQVVEGLQGGINFLGQPLFSQLIGIMESNTA